MRMTTIAILAASMAVVVNADDLQILSRGRFGTGAIGIPHCYDRAPGLSEKLLPYQGRNDIQSREELLLIIAEMEGKKPPSRQPRGIVDIFRENCYECHSGARNDGGIDLIEWGRFTCEKKRKVLTYVTRSDDLRMPYGRDRLAQEDINTIAAEVAKTCNKKPEGPVEPPKKDDSAIDEARLLSILKKERESILGELKEYLKSVKGDGKKIKLEPIEFEIDVDSYRSNAK